MDSYCVVVADGVRARFFTLEAADFPGIESGPRLVEHEDLVNPEAEIPGREIWTDAKTGRNTAPIGGPAHGYDDHRDQHEDEFMRRFAAQVAGRVVGACQEQRARRLVLVAGKRMLGFLRDALEVPPKVDIVVRDLAKDLIKLSAHELHEHLGGAGLLPPRKKPAL